jgi:3-hydroxybutyryl-CoA dehydratase
METGVLISKLTEGIDLPVMKRIITQAKINLYAEASQDFNPIHIDQDFAKKTPLGGTIAHGMLVLAYLSQMMTAVFGPSWLDSGKLNVRFKSPARPNDTITVSGKVNKIDRGEEQTVASCDVLCANQKGEPVITGEAKVEVKNHENSR